jgi:hypothetical protein
MGMIVDPPFAFRLFPVRISRDIPFGRVRVA